MHHIEELKILSKAKAYYNEALILDPNDKNIISSIKRIEEKKNKRNIIIDPRDKNSNSEVEVGEDMPLEISERAINMRIEEENNSLNNNQDKK